MALKPKDVKALKILAVIALLGGGYYIYSSPYQQYKDWEGDITEIQGQIEQARRNAPRLAEVQGEISELQEALERSMTRLPPPQEMAQFLDFILELFDEAGISSTQIGTKALNDPIPEGYVLVHPIDISNIQGLNRDQIVTIMTLINNYQRILVVRSMSLRSNTDGTFDMDLGLETYTLAEDDEPAGVE